MDTQLEVLKILINFEQGTGEIKQNILNTFCGYFTGDKDAYASTTQTKDDRGKGITHNTDKFKYRIHNGQGYNDFDLKSILARVSSLKDNINSRTFYPRYKTVLILYFSMLYKHFCDQDLFSRYPELQLFRSSNHDESYKYRLIKGRDGLYLTPEDFFKKLKNMGISKIFNGNKQKISDFEKNFKQYYYLFDTFNLDEKLSEDPNYKVKTSELCSDHVLPPLELNDSELKVKKNELWDEFIKNILNMNPRDLTREFVLKDISRLDREYIDSIKEIYQHDDNIELLEGLFKYIIYHTIEIYKEDLSVPYGKKFNILLTLAKQLINVGVYEQLITDPQRNYYLFSEVYVPLDMEVDMDKILIELNGINNTKKVPQGPPPEPPPEPPPAHVLLAYIMIYGGGIENNHYNDVIKNLLNIMADKIDGLDRNDITAAIEIYSDIQTKLSTPPPFGTRQTGV